MPFERDDPDGLLVAIAIADTGAGMSDAVKERAFEPFFTTKEVGRGTGLGLSTVYGFVKQSQGAIGPASEAGRGTTVTLYLPADLARPAEPDVVVANTAIPVGLKVLLVEDEPEVRAVAVRFLQAFGCEVTPCATAEQALVRLGQPGAFELLLTDIELGAGQRGTELAREARLAHPALAVLLVSGYPAALIEHQRDGVPRHGSCSPSPIPATSCATRSCAPRRQHRITEGWPRGARRRRRGRRRRGS